jgi:hypothetical protein
LGAPYLAPNFFRVLKGKDFPFLKYQKFGGKKIYFAKKVVPFLNYSERKSI